MVVAGGHTSRAAVLTATPIDGHFQHWPLERSIPSAAIKAFPSPHCHSTMPPNKTESIRSQSNDLLGTTHDTISKVTQSDESEFSSC